jgi:hypothetical protein
MTNQPTQQLHVIPPRAHRIAAVHALPQWLADHPGIDTPDTVRAVRVVPEATYAEPERRVAEVLRFAEVHGGHLGEDPLWVWASIPIGSVVTHGVSVDYTVYASKGVGRVLPLPPRTC